MARRADAMAFFGMPGQPPTITSDMAIDLALVTCAPPWAPTTSMVLEEAEKFKVALFQNADSLVTIATHTDDIVMAREDNSTAIILGLQNLPDNVDITALKGAGIQVISLAYDTVNMYGSGCMNLDVGLTQAGKDVLRAMDQEKGMILDLAHASHRMAREVLRFIHEARLFLPVMASHTGCYGVYPHFRNLPDQVLREIAERGGVIGIPTLEFILGNGNEDINHFRAHIRHAINVCGIESVVIGSDGTYSNVDEEQARAQFEMMRTKIDPQGTWGARYPEHPEIFLGPNKLEHIANSIRDIAGEKTHTVVGENLVQFFERSLFV
ncbi:MAG: Zn-dependent dipeptidase [Candidatus Wolfebacteria bacterium GW2011_GWC2_39_22]|uniref:Zn-dependent dipeptidase n=2 Tax=Candidatus Wolfeibacteriota TaxID=1752735 RepID=A0A0G1JIM7_9BACT|nr:MAG: Zn-dependent dipeptidase [Candidatus Wolfebacteria bacterium GW2011_GWC2_39_22]KKT43837.1 MAG: Zn-dependent dipeptidase [Candidatus Wolfebacteria bacterium GW2011_GWE2_44_13]HBI25436.1 hypothetical protein [Candidatus Wolfebacteria bacterium]